MSIPWLVHTVWIQICFLRVGEACVPQPGVMLLQDVFAVKVKRRRAVGQQSGGAVLGVAVFCCRRRGKRLEEDTLHFHNASAEHTHHWYDTLKELLTGNTFRCSKFRWIVSEKWPWCWGVAVYVDICIVRWHLVTGNTFFTLQIFHLGPIPFLSPLGPTWSICQKTNPG